MVTTQEVQQFGPNLLRTTETIEAAALELAELGRLHVLKDGRRKCLVMNPFILRVGPVATAIPAIPAIPTPSMGRPGANNSSKNSSSNHLNRENRSIILPLVARADWDNSEPLEV